MAVPAFKKALSILRRDTDPDVKSLTKSAESFFRKTIVLTPPIRIYDHFDESSDEIIEFSCPSGSSLLLTEAFELTDEGLPAETETEIDDMLSKIDYAREVEENLV